MNNTIRILKTNKLLNDFKQGFKILNSYFFTTDNLFFEFDLQKRNFKKITNKIYNENKRIYNELYFL